MRDPVLHFLHPVASPHRTTAKGCQTACGRRVPCWRVVRDSAGVTCKGCIAIAVAGARPAEQGRRKRTRRKRGEAFLARTRWVDPRQG